MTHRLLLSFLLVGAAVTSGCVINTTPSCNDNISQPGLDVVVVDQATGDRICDAVVTAVDGAYSEDLQPAGPVSSCDYQGAFERPGTYEVDVSRASYQDTFVTDIPVDQGGCHVITQAVTVEMSQ